MSELKKEFEFLLKDNIQYSDGAGSFTKAKKLLLKAPFPKHKKYTLNLRQKFMQAIKSSINSFSSSNNISKSTEIQSENIKGDDLITILLMSDVDIVNFSDIFKDLILDGVCLVDGKIPLISTMYDELSEDESLRLMGEYFENFLLPSSMRQQKIN